MIKDIKKLLVFGNKGKIIKRIRVAGSSRAKKPPIIEASFENSVNTVLRGFATENAADNSEFFQKLQEIYEQRGQYAGFGHYGDVITVIGIEYEQTTQYLIASIDQLAFPKGIIAVDFLPFFIDKNGQEFFVGITLGKKGPNYGKPALIGGHIDHDDGYFESAAEAIVHEAEEEANIILEAMGGIDIGKYPIPKSFPITVQVGSRKVEATVEYLDTLRTAEDKPEEKKKKASWENRKRVDWTIAYHMIVNVDFNLSEELLRHWFKAGSDAEDLLIVPSGLNDPIPEFAYEHHRDIYVRARNLKEYIMRSKH